MPLPITAIFAGLLALWMIYLLIKVVGFRRGKQVSLGTAGDDEGERLVRGHANATETIPIFLILLGLAEGLGTPGWVLWIVGGMFLVGRVLHGLHFIQGRKDFNWRRWGMQLTLLAIALTALGAIGHGLASL